MHWMKKKQKSLKPKSSSKKILRIFFNASVIISGFRSRSGGSGELLNLVNSKKIKGLISETVLDEVLRHFDKTKLRKDDIESKIIKIFQNVYKAPSESETDNYYRFMKDVGDAHLFASSKSLKADYLVSLDKKHVLSLKGKVKNLKIVSPGELIKILKSSDALS